MFDCIAYGAYSFEEDVNLIYKTNFSSIVNFVETLAGQSLAVYVHAGSSSEYGSNSNAPSEDSVCKPNSHYAVSKVALANYLNYIGKHRGFPCINLRLYSVYGPLEDTSRFLPNLLAKAKKREFPPLVDPETSRDYIYIDDVCDAFIMAAAKIHPGLYGESFNIGSGIKTTVAEIAFMTKGEFNVIGEPKFGSMEGRVWDLKEWRSDPRKAMTLLGWQPKVTLKEGLRAMFAWVTQLTEEDMTSMTKKNKLVLKKSVSAIVACYKDELAIPIMHRRLTDTFKKIGIEYEIIFVNDGSPDSSMKVIRDISANDSHVIGITHSRNFGSQMAFRSGMEICTMDSVVLLDGDLQDPPEIIEMFYKKWEEGYDVVYGRRIKRDMPWYREVLYKLFYRVFASFSYVQIPIDAGDFSLMDRRVVRWLLNCPERDLFVRGLRAYIGFKQTGVDYVRPERMFGESTNSILKNIEWAKKGIFSYSNTPLTILTYVGVITLVFSMIVGLVVATLRVLIPEIAPKGVSTLLITTLVFGSFNLFAVGMLGEYIAKIMVEVKGRPRLIRSALTRNGETTEMLPIK